MWRVLEFGFVLACVGLVVMFITPVVWAMFRRWMKWVDRESSQ